MLTHRFTTSLRRPMPGLVLAALVSTLAGCMSSSPRNGTAESRHSVRFYTIGNKIPVVKTQLNGKQAWFIIDTGASLSLLNTSNADYFGFSVNNGSLQKKAELNGLGGKLTLHDTFACHIRIGDLSINHFAWKSMDMNELFATLERNEKLIIAGILGSDLLFRYRINIDYDTRTLSYRVRKHKEMPGDSLTAVTPGEDVVTEKYP